MSKLDEPRIEMGRAMLLGGIRRIHPFQTEPTAIPNQWLEFTRLRPLTGQIGDTTYGVICGADETAQTFEYMCAAEVESLEPLPKEGRMRIAPQQYAVFTHRGRIDSIRATWNAAFSGWLPKSAYRSAHKPDFERYDERFDTKTASGEVELWIAVVAAQS